MKAWRTIFLAGALIFSLETFAQQVSRSVAISAYLFNFAKNMQWQHEDQLHEFSFLVLGDDEDIFKELSTLSKTKTIRNKPIRVISATFLKDLDRLQLIYAPKGYENQLVRIFDQIEGKNILLVSDGFADKRLIMINFFDSEKGTLHFEINKANILNQQMQVTQDLILLGGTEIDVAALYREGQQSLRTLQKQNEALEQGHRQLEASLGSLEKTIELRNQEVRNNRDSLNRQSFLLSNQQQILNNQSQQLKGKEKELIDKLRQIEEQQLVFNQQKIDLNKQTEKLKKGDELLQNQKIELAKRKADVRAQKRILKEQGSTISRQRHLMEWLFLVILLVALLGVSIYIGYRGKRKRNLELENKVEARTRELNILNEQLQQELIERKRIQKELTELNLTLEHRVAERTGQLTEINKELESFSYSISHDLRAPLRAIYGFSQILSTRHKESLNEEGREYMQYIVEASVRMEKLINDLLAFSRLGRKSVELKMLPFKEILSSILDDFKQRLAETDTTLQVDDDFPMLPGDESLFRQIFTNLIENAINYRRTDVKSTIGIHWKAVIGGVEIRVIDNGIGIPKEYLGKIFKIFQRLHAEDEYPGTGIGLATVQKAVGLLNGTITVESVVGKGSTFILFFCKE
jgi:signal transduction histidine kinase